MKELNSNEIQSVSGAGLQQFLAGLNNALSNVNTALTETTSALESSTSKGETIGLTHKQFGLNIASGHMTSLYNFLSSFSKSA
ncbi:MULTISPECIES: hypothetical protein [Pantoea]|jgi:hypothetical protein|uniref:hypothetical protein n=1 Tax=Pantoea TaxID=53335 RepID=UPI001F20CC1C|nr:MULTISPECIES: hypothetical protein [Pantoea]UIL52447.1 hypothetical protein LZU96_00240 [Pantoea agglomerans]